jgi:hypothetical protein
MKNELPSNFLELTKKYAPEERQETANEIRSLRSQYFEQSRLLEEKINNLEPHLQNNLEEVQRLENEYQILIKDISDLRSSIFTRLFRKSQIKSQEERLYSICEQIAMYEEKYIEISNQLEEIRNTKADKSRLQSARNILSEFYEVQSKLVPQYEERQKKEFEIAEIRRKENERASSIESVVEDRDVFFVHAINTNYTPEGNSMLSKDADWKSKLKIVLGFEPTISASSISEGDGPRNFWAHFGILLKNGLIVEAHNCDASTVAVDMEIRKKRGQNVEVSLSEQVNNAIGSRRSYNEFVVDDFEVAGLFIFPEEDIASKRNKNFNMPSHLEVAEEAKKVNLPVFIFSDGNFIPAIFDEEKQTYISEGDHLKPIDILDIDSEIPEDMRLLAREEIFKDSPFEMDKLNESAYEDFSCLQSYAQGRKMFTGLYSGRNKIIGGNKVIVDKETVRTICKFPEPGLVNHLYVTKDGDVINDRLQKDKIYSSRQIVLDDFKGEYIEIGFNSWKLGKINGIRSYTQLVEQSIRETMERISGKIEGDDEKAIAFEKKLFKNCLNRVVSHCLGFAEQAELLGDNQAAESARQVASLVMEKSKLEEILKKRLGPNGEMIITEKDLYRGERSN